MSVESLCDACGKAFDEREVSECRRCGMPCCDDCRPPEFHDCDNHAGADMNCDGACEERGGHQGTVTRVRVTSMATDWGEFDYCEAAIARDRSKGFTVEEVDTAGDAGSKET